jgi:hypothetical protein
MLLILHLHGRKVQHSLKLHLSLDPKIKLLINIQKIVLKELGVIAVETIEKMDEEIELKDNKINVLEKELKDVNHYDEQKIQALLNKKTCN